MTTDGTTLLGADDKAGIAVILTMVDWLRTHPGLPHGALRVGFTPDEEVRQRHRALRRGGLRGEIRLHRGRRRASGEMEDETFCADTAIVTINGHDVHPGYAKGVMVNALRVARRSSPSCRGAACPRPPKAGSPSCTPSASPATWPGPN